MLFENYWRMLSLVQASYTPEKRQSELQTDLPAFVLYRPLSFWITPFFYWAGCSANTITTLGLVAAFVMPLAAIVGHGYACILVTSVALIIQVLDCIDGNIARTKQQSSTIGQMLDGISTLLFWVLYFVTIGIIGQNLSTGFVSRHGIEIGLGLGILLLVQRELEDTYDNCFQERIRWEPPLPKKLPVFELSGIGRVIEQLYAFILLPIAHALGRLDLFIITLVIYQVVLFTLWTPRFIKAVYMRAKVLPLMSKD